MEHGETKNRSKGENIGIMDKIERVILRMEIDESDSDVMLLEERSKLKEDRNIEDCIYEAEDMASFQSTTGRMNRFKQIRDINEGRENKMRCDDAEGQDRRQRTTRV